MSDPTRDLARDATNAGLFLDFDGTLSEIAFLPHEARPVEGVPDLLQKLSHAFKVVAIVSGRSAHQLVEWLGPDIEVWGVHGAEHNRSGDVELTHEARRFAELMQVVKKEAEDRVAELGIDGVVIEDKRVMLGLHFRAAADLERAKKELDLIADDLARGHGLIRAGGRLAYELRPPQEFTKAAVVLERVREEELTAVAFVGDDRVDLPGFDALDLLAEEGATTVRVAVDSAEVPPQLIERADIVVDGPSGAVLWLEELLDRVG